MAHPFSKANLIINRMIGRTYHNPLGEPAFLQAGRVSKIGAKSRVLDVGTGRGYGAVYLARKFGADAAGIDISSLMIKEARELARANPGLRVKFVKTPLSDFSPPQKFDLICCFDVMGFIPNRAESVASFARLLKNGGRLAFSDYFYRRKTRAVHDLIGVWNLQSIGTYAFMKRRLEKKDFRILYYKDTSNVYRKYWQGIKTRLMKSRAKIVRAVGKKSFDGYLSSVDSIIDATKDGSFGHVSGMAVKVMETRINNADDVSSGV